MLKSAIARTSRTTLQSVRYQSAVAEAGRSLSNAYVGKLETRWVSLPKQDQTQLINDLKTRMELNWKELLVEEKKAAYYISFGEWGPRKPLHAPGEAQFIVMTVAGCMVASMVIYLGITSFGAKGPSTLNREWQDASDEYLKSKNANPFTGYSQVQ